MRAYEDWYLKNLCGDKQFSEPAWKAALEWALESGSWESVAYNIREELKNSKT